MKAGGYVLPVMLGSCLFSGVYADDQSLNELNIRITEDVKLKEWVDLVAEFKIILSVSGELEELQRINAAVVKDLSLLVVWGDEFQGLYNEASLHWARIWEAVFGTTGLPYYTAEAILVMAKQHLITATILLENRISLMVEIVDDREAGIIKEFIANASPEVLDGLDDAGFSRVSGISDAKAAGAAKAREWWNGEMTGDEFGISVAADREEFDKNTEALYRELGSVIKELQELLNDDIFNDYERSFIHRLIVKFGDMKEGIANMRGMKTS